MLMFVTGITYETNERHTKSNHNMVFPKRNER